MMRCSCFGVFVIVVASATACMGADGVALRVLGATVKIRDDERAGSGFLVTLPTTDAGGEAATRDGNEGSSDAVETVLVTAAHAFTASKGSDCVVTFRAAGGAAGYERRDLRLRLKEGEKTLWVRHPTADVAVIGITPPADAEVRPFAREDIADAARIESGAVAVGCRTWIACYPAQVEGHGSGWPVLRHGTIASHPLLPVSSAATFFVDYSHFGGDSGAPAVIDVDGRPVVAGVVVGMKRQTDRMRAPFEERTMHTPLDLAVVVHPVLVSETIDAWRRGGR